MKIQSFCVKESKDTKTTTPHNLPIYATSSFNFESMSEGIDIFSGKTKGHVYGRYGNPTIEAVANKIAKMESYGSNIEAAALMTSSGMSAISTLFAGVLEKGDVVLCQGNLYGGTTELLQKIFQKMGIEPLFVDLGDLNAVESALKNTPAIRMVYFESPSNPTLDCVDIEALVALAKQSGVLSAIDNTFCTPYLQQPLTLGVDYSIHSTTKYLNGHGNSTAGVIVAADKESLATKIWTAMKLLGTNCNPWDAWLTNNGIKTLALRMDKHCYNALGLANYLEGHNKVRKVNYNGLKSHKDYELASRQMKNYGGMMSFEIDGSVDDAVQVMNNIKFCSLAPTLGDVDTLILHPASMSHMNIPKEMRLKNGITDELIRVSVGIEDLDDIIADFEGALGSM